MADGVGFEPTRRLPAYTRSRRAPSTTRPPILVARASEGARGSFDSPLPRRGAFDHSATHPSRSRQPRRTRVFRFAASAAGRLRPLGPLEEARTIQAPGRGASAGPPESAFGRDAPASAAKSGQTRGAGRVCRRRRNRILSPAKGQDFA